MTEGVRRGTRWSTSASRSYDGKFHTVDSSDMAFQIAGLARASRRRRSRPAWSLLEPIVEVEVVVPETPTPATSSAT